MQVKAISACPDTDSTNVTADPAAMFSALYAEFFGRVCAVVNRRVEDWDLAQELTQEMFCGLWEQVAAGTLDLAEIYAPLGFLANRAKWAVAHYLRSTRVLAEESTRDDVLVKLADRDEHPIDVVTARLSVGQMVFGLPFASRRALALHLWEDMPVQAVAEQTGQSVHAVKAQVAEGLAELRALMGVRAEQVAAQVSAAADRERGRRLRVMAAPKPVSRAAYLRQALRAAIVDGWYRPGTALPGRMALADLHIGKDDRRLSDPTADVVRALTALCADGLLTRIGATYTVTEQAPALATRPEREQPTARQNIARELLAGAWPVGTRLPARRDLAARWGHHLPAVRATFNELIDLGVLAIAPGGGLGCVVVALPATEPTTQPVPGRVPAPRRSPEDRVPALVRV
jgi:RNA polymerase sigma factor (sigma-70 family)